MKNVFVKKMRLLLLLFIMQFCMISSSHAGSLYVAEKGIMLGYGYGEVGESHRTYRPLLFIYHIGFSAHKLFPSIIPETHNRLTFYLEPQYNRVIRPGGNYEFGLGFGAEYRFKLIKGFSDGYVLAGSGLHYISFDSKYQSGGFNFNDNLGLGLYVFLSHHSALNLGFRFRHISNANINLPNEGINSYLFVLGYSVFF